MSPVSAPTALALREVMARLLDGRPLHCDGALSIANLAREAGVSRATANRAGDLVETFRQATAERPEPGPDTPAALRARIRQLEADRAARDGVERQEITQLRTAVTALAQHVQALTLDNDALRQALHAYGEVRTLPNV